ncbi:hypothetical protein CXB51_022115 [Gossypium anomalum]|uniref:Reverse transcriptase Ty1/copia-type domain-containing protein n=1 Tax=Gossypium anomalum TaxID=47600 RepID=A0A8J6CUV4_9ROSI|nr:hypothetical protein CXB51_022115 [Gossypium anomalum]
METHKARLVGKGYTQKEGFDYDETFSLGAMLKSISIRLSITTTLDYEICQIDINKAFLNSYLNETIYMAQPTGYVVKGNEQKVCELLRSIYGLKQASRSWNKRFEQTIKTFGFEQNVDEPCVYKCIKDKKWYSSSCMSMIFYLSKKMQENCHRLNCASYIDKVYECFTMTDAKLGIQPAVSGFHLSLDDCPKTMEERQHMSKVSYASAVGHGAILWRSVNQTCTANSTIEAEYMVTSEAMNEAIWPQKFLTELEVIHGMENFITLYFDNNDAIGNTKEMRSQKRTEHIDRKYHLI